MAATLRGPSLTARTAPNNSRFPGKLSRGAKAGVIGTKVSRDGPTPVESSATREIAVIGGAFHLRRWRGAGRVWSGVEASELRNNCLRMGSVRVEPRPGIEEERGMGIQDFPAPEDLLLCHIGNVEGKRTMGGGSHTPEQVFHLRRGKELFKTFHPS